MHISPMDTSLQCDHASAFACVFSATYLRNGVSTRAPCAVVPSSATTSQEPMATRWVLGPATSVAHSSWVMVSGGRSMQEVACTGQTSLPPHSYLARVIRRDHGVLPSLRMIGKTSDWPSMNPSPDRMHRLPALDEIPETNSAVL